MNFKKPLLLACAVLCLAGFTSSTFNLTTAGAQSKRSAAAKQNLGGGPILTATLTDAFPDPDSNGRAAAGEEVTYTATVTNSGDAPATGVTFAVPVDTSSTLVAGSEQVQPDLSTFAARCTFDTAPDVAGGGSLCTLTSSPYGKTGTDNYTILGGQGNRFNFGATNPVYNNKSEVFSFDGTVQNLMQQRMGTIDGVTADAAQVRVFVNSMRVTSGTGTITAFNATGTGSFTGVNQPYFQFPEMLIFGEITQPKNIEFSVPNTVGAFTVDFLVSTKIEAKLVINEVLSNPGGVISDANGEWFEIYNNGLFPVNMQGFKLGDRNGATDQPLHTVASSAVIAAGGYFVFGNTVNTTNNGGVPVQYAYASALALANTSDCVRLVSPASDLVELDRADYTNLGISTLNGVSRELINVSTDNFNMDSTNWQNGTATYGPGGKGTPGNANTVAPPLTEGDSATATVSDPEGSGTVSADLGTIGPGESAIITYRVIVTDPIDSGTTQLSAQGSVSAANFGDILTDDPATGPGGDSTKTLLGFAPSAADVSISGRVITSDGRGLTNAVVLMADHDGWRKFAVTNAFGYYQLDGVAAGGTYSLVARHKTHHFDTRIVTVGDEITGLDFTAID